MAQSAFMCCLLSLSASFLSTTLVVVVPPLVLLLFPPLATFACMSISIDLSHTVQISSWPVWSGLARSKCNQNEGGGGGFMNIGRQLQLAGVDVLFFMEQQAQVEEEEFQRMRSRSGVA